MIRTLVLAVSAAAMFAAAPAGAAEIRIKTTGKAPTELRAEIAKAARSVCWQDARGDTMVNYVYTSCVRASINQAVSKLGDTEQVVLNQDVASR